MTSFDNFKKRKPIAPLLQLCCDIVYFILARYAHEEFVNLDGLCRQFPNAAGPFFYLMVYQNLFQALDAEESDEPRIQREATIG